MKSVNVQIRLPERVSKEIENYSEGSKSAFIRDAIEEKIEKEKARKLEEVWIQSLKKHPEDSVDLSDWLESEHWYS